MTFDSYEVKGAIETALKALESCEAKLEYLGRVFSSTNFTDRHGDGPDCLHRAHKARNAISTLKGAFPATRSST